ncbi:MAG: formylglycine-generating enzyme family protein, partial [Planctomycetota bacterium]
NIENSRAHTVNISKDFYIGVFEVSQRQWFEVMGSWPSYFTSDRDKRPVEQISWNDIKGSSGFIDTISQRTGISFDLPTEAEWEYCCRAGTNSYFSFGDSSGDAYRWSSSNSDTGNGNETHEVGTKLPNPWGLYDMHGNVCEWCLDYFSYFYYEICINSGIVSNPEGAIAGSTRIFRGGSFNGYSSLSAVRYYAYPYNQSNGIGLRVVLVQRDN